MEVEISSHWIKHRVAVKLREGLDDDVETEGDDGQGGEGDQEAEHVRPGDPVQTTVGTSDSVNPELVHPILYRYLKCGICRCVKCKVKETEFG